MASFSRAVERNRILLMEGAVGVRLRLEYGCEPDAEVALASYACAPRSRRALAEVYGEYMAVAERRGAPFMATAPTRRLNRERVAASRFGAGIAAENIAFLRGLRPGYGGEMYVGGTMGCRGNAYTGEGAMDAAEAERFHAWAAELFADAGADYLFAGIMPTVPEAAGLARACAATGLPYIVSFMLDWEGRLVDGHSIDEAIRRIDAAADPAPLCYMANCVHSDYVLRGLEREYNRTETVARRFLGIMPNASRLPSDCLDGAGERCWSAPEDLAASVAALGKRMTIRILGGCCGTDARHLDAMAGALL